MIRVYSHVAHAHNRYTAGSSPFLHELMEGEPEFCQGNLSDFKDSRKDLFQPHEEEKCKELASQEILMQTFLKPEIHI